MDPACAQELFAPSLVLATCPSSCCIVIFCFLLELIHWLSLPLLHDPLNPTMFHALKLPSRLARLLQAQLTAHPAPPKQTRSPYPLSFILPASAQLPGAFTANHQAKHQQKASESVHQLSHYLLPFSLIALYVL